MKLVTLNKKLRKLTPQEAYAIGYDNGYQKRVEEEQEAKDEAESIPKFIYLPEKKGRRKNE